MGLHSCSLGNREGVLRIRFDHLSCFLDDMGGIRYYEKNGHEEHSLGSINNSGIFEPASWLLVDDQDCSDLRESLLSSYFGETELYVSKSQSDWPADVLNFLKLPELDFCSKNLTTIYNHGESASELRRRYQRIGGEVLHGVYEKIAETGPMEWLLIDAGCLKGKWELYGEAKEDTYGSAKFLVIDQHETSWKKTDSSEESMDELLAQAVLDQQIPRAEIFVGRKKDMLNWAEKAEEHGLDVEVYSHRSDGEKYRLILSSTKTAQEWLSGEQLGKFLESANSFHDKVKILKGELLAQWESLTPKNPYSENFSLSAQAFMNSFWKGQPLRIGLSQALKHS